MIVLDGFEIGLILVFLVAIIFGWRFAKFTNEVPPPEGFTYLYVIIGVAFTLLFIAIGQVLAALAGMGVIFILSVPGLMFAITGGFMTAYQETKRQTLAKTSDNVLSQIEETYFKKRVT